jgi:hypothetical protein
MREVAVLVAERAAQRGERRVRVAVDELRVAGA